MAAERRAPAALRGLSRVACACLVACVLAASVVVSAGSSADAQVYADIVRIVARRTTSGKVEFGVEAAQADGSWGDRFLPEKRFFPPDAAVGRWLASSTFYDDVGEMRIVARRTENGSIEFGLQEAPPGTTAWGGRLLPDKRFFPTDAAVGRWLQSSAVRRVLLASTPAPPPAAGTCAPSADGTLYCTRQAGRTTNLEELRVHLNAFVAMLRPHWPWIGVALESTGGWSYGSCDHPQAAGCYNTGENRIVLASANLAGQPLWAIEETLIHELAHAYDWAATPDDEPERQPSVRSMTAYPVEFRHELFADTLAVNVLGNRSSPVYFQESRRAFGLAYERWYDAAFTSLDRRSFDAAADRIPASPTVQDRRAVWQAICGNCGTRAPAVVWTAADGTPDLKQGRRSAGLLIDFPQPPKIDITVILPCVMAVPSEIRRAISQAEGAAGWGRMVTNWLDYRDAAGANQLHEAGAQLEAAADRLDAAVDRICAETPGYVLGEPDPFVIADHLYAEAERLCAAAARLAADINARLRSSGPTWDRC